MLKGGLCPQTFLACLVWDANCVIWCETILFSFVMSFKSCASVFTSDQVFFFGRKSVKIKVFPHSIFYRAPFHPGHFLFSLGTLQATQSQGEESANIQRGKKIIWVWQYNGRNILIKNARIFNYSISQTICTWKAYLHSYHWGARPQQDDWLARFLFLHLSSIFSTFINVELSSFYETYHKMECSLKVTVTKWIPLLLNFHSSIAQYIYFWLL